MAAAPAPGGRDERLIGLFVDSTGIILVAGTKPGYYGFYSPQGGLFTNQFLRIIAESDPSTALGWGDIKRRFSPMTAQYQGKVYEQMPIMEP